MRKSSSAVLLWAVVSGISMAMGCNGDGGVFNLTVTKSGSGNGTATSSPSGINCGATCSAHLSIGTSVVLVVMPASGSTFAGWSGAPGCSGGWIKMYSDITCTATFDLIPPERATAVAAGGTHSLALKSDGTVWGWGTDGSVEGAFGPPGYWSLAPVQVLSLNGVVAIAGGGGHSLALKSDGTVWAWGYGNAGALGDGENLSSAAPVQVLDLSGVVAIAGGDRHSLALKDDGTVWAWGVNDYGQLGTGAMGMNSNSDAPVEVPNLTGVVAISGGEYHSLALKNDGTVWAWGSRGYYLGNGTAADGTVPVQVFKLTGVVAVAAGYSNSMALKKDGTVWAWGLNYAGQLGDGTTTDRTVPVQVPNLTSVTAVAKSDNQSLALKSDGTVWAW